MAPLAPGAREGKRHPAAAPLALPAGSTGQAAPPRGGRGSRRGAAGPGPGGGRRDRGRSSRATPGRALPPQHTHTHTRTHASAGPCPQRPGRSPRERYAIARTPAPRRRDAATYSSGPPSNRRAAGGGCGSPSSRQRPLPTGGSG